MTTQTLTNPSGLHPQGKAVLVLPYNPEMKKSTLVIPSAVADRGDMIEERAVVIEIGPESWKGETPRAKVGDKVLISKYSGAIAKGVKDGVKYRLVNCEDIYCTIEEIEDVA